MRYSILMIKVLETASLVVERSEVVHINTDKIETLVEQLSDERMPPWLHNSPIDFSHLSDTDFLNFLLVLHSVSFCYWGDVKWTVEYRGSLYHGAWGMVAAIMRAIDEGKPILDSQYRAKISSDEYAEILRGNITIPLLTERWKITREVAGALLSVSDGDFISLIRHTDKDALYLLDLLINLCPSFEDSSSYEGKTTYFYKRAQLLVEDTSQFLRDRGDNDLENINVLTACADYKLPQVLERLGILSYTEPLKEKIVAKICILHDSVEEIEIRANTIWAIEMMRQSFKKRGKDVPSRVISNYIWLLGKERSTNITPHHRTITTAY
jgi:hypothetical protein